MPQNYVPIFIFMAFVGVLLPLTLLAAKLVRPDNPSKSKLMPYECGIDPIDSARGRYTVRYYIVAILFVVFDVETIFLFPWAVKFKFRSRSGSLQIKGERRSSLLPGEKSAHRKSNRYSKCRCITRTARRPTTQSAPA